MFFVSSETDFYSYLSSFLFALILFMATVALNWIVAGCGELRPRERPVHIDNHP